MKISRNDLSLYLVSNRSWLKGRKLEDVIEEALKAGVTFIQLREKNMCTSRFKSEGEIIKKLCQKYRVPFVINDNINLAIEIEADGVHIGQSDISVMEARKILGREKILGVSVTNRVEALKGEANGASYLGVGSIFHTNTKPDADKVSIKVLKEICAAVKIPVVAIGGINKGNIEELVDTGISGVSVISAILAEENILKATEELFNKLKFLKN